MSVTSEKKQASEGGLLETVKVIFHALLLALVVRTFFYQPFNIPSGSMKSTLLIGDYLFVSKYSYGYSKYSLPFSPNLFSGRIWASEPERGDIAVFKLPRDNTTDYIKRVIGLPGDEIQVVGGVLHINGKPVTLAKTDNFIDSDAGGRQIPVMRYKETLPNSTDTGPGVVHDVLDLVDGEYSDNTPIFKVPEGHYFMMGDNRDNSTDSRFGQVGFVPQENLIGRAEIIFFSVEDGAYAWQFWRWPWTVRWDRLFTLL
ncbi:MAG: signal peptidase I [Hyphomicrobiales bacterium]|nr:signal peptidase I [Hyphomicrobiales bacterium]